MSDLLNDCMTVLRAAGFDLVPADVIAPGGKVRDWGIEQRNAAHQKGVQPHRGTVATLPRYTTGCPQCDRMPFGMACEDCDLATTQHEASCYGQ